MKFERPNEIEVFLDNEEREICNQAIGVLNEIIEKMQNTDFDPMFQVPNEDLYSLNKIEDIVEFLEQISDIFYRPNKIVER